MKICILSTSYPRSKDDYWVPFMHSLARELAKTEDVTVVTSSGPKAKSYEVRDNVKIHRFNYFYPGALQVLTYSGGMKESFKSGLLPKIQAPFFMLAFFLKSLSTARKCDVINAHWALSGIAALPLKMFCKKPIILTEHGGSIRSLPKWLNRLVLKRMDAVTSAHYDMLEAIKKMGISNVYDIKNFLNEERFLRRHDIKSIKKELKIKNELVAAFVGRFEELKDPLTFVNSIPYVLESAKNVKFVMVGDGHLKNEIESQINKLKLKKFVIMPGPTPEVDKFLAISDVFIACSAKENCFSTTILESMLSKVPCIITKAGMTEKFFVHRQDAFLVEKSNPKALGRAIAGLLNDKSLRAKISKNGLKFLDRHGFRNSIIIKKWLKLLSDIRKA